MALHKTASLRQLATFQIVARMGSVSLAAEELHLSQSAVSIQIASLESSVGASLVERTGRGVRLTEAGELLVVYADRLLNLWNEASDEMSTFLGDFSGTLRVGAVTTAEYWLPRLLVTFINANPRVKLRLLFGNREEVVRGLASQEVDIAVMGQPPEELQVIASTFAKNPMAFVASPRHPLMAESTVTMALLAQAPLLVRERGSGTRNTVERLFRDAGMRPRIGSELSSNEAIKQMCAAGFGPAFLSMHTCSLELKAGLLKLLPMQNNPIEREWFMVRAASRPSPQVVIAFEQYLRDHGQDEIHQQGSKSMLPPVKKLAR
jgi:LysR family transcriptional regulator, low CO2-responsive transcriptional regulator